MLYAFRAVTSFLKEVERSLSLTHGKGGKKSKEVRKKFYPFKFRMVLLSLFNFFPIDTRENR